MQRLVKISELPRNNQGLSSSNWNKVFQGPRTYKPFATTADICMLETLATLIMLEFKEGTEHVGQYLGLWDIDFVNLTKEDQFQLKNGHVCDKIKPCLAILAKVLENVPYRVYFSGSKGLHVYILDKRLMINFGEHAKLNEMDYTSVIQQMYGEEIAEMLDYSPFVRGHGIRPYFFPNPKTGVYCTRLVNHLGFDIDDWWASLQHWEFEDRSKNKQHLQQQRIHTSPTNTESVPVETIGWTQSETVTESTLQTLCRQLEEWQEGATENYYRIHRSNNQKTKSYVFPKCFWCPIAKKQHQHTGTSYWTVFDKSHAVLTCYGSCQRKTYRLVMNNTPAATMIPEEYKKRIKEAVIIPKNQVYISSEDIKAKSGNLIFVNAPMGSGKTYALREICKNTSPEDRILALCTRVVQSRFFEGVLSDGDQCVFTNYKICPKGYLDEYKRLILCVNSLARYCPIEMVHGEPVQKVPKVKLLIMDEIDEMIHTLCGRQIDSWKTPVAMIWKLLSILIDSAETVVFLDGLPGPLTWRYFDEMGYLPRLTCISKPLKTDYRTYRFYANAYTFMRRYKECLAKTKEENYAVAVVCNVKKQMQGMVQEAGTDLRVLQISGMSSDEEKNTALDPDIEWSKVDVLAYNSAVGPGASFSVKNYFNELFCYVVSNTITPTAMLQLIHRLRSIENAMVHVLVHPRKGEEMKTQEEIISKYAENTLRMYQQGYVFNVMDKVPGKIESLKMVENPETHYLSRELVADTDYVQLRLENIGILRLRAEVEHQRLRFSCSKNYKQELVRLIQSTGGLIEEVGSLTENPVQMARFGVIRRILTESANNAAYNTFYIKPMEVLTVEAQRQEFIKLVDYDSWEHHVYFKELRKLEDNRPTVDYIKEFQCVQRGQFLPYMCQSSVWKPALKRLLDHLRVSIDKRTGSMSGMFTHTEFLRPEIIEEMQTIAEVYNRRVADRIKIDLQPVEFDTYKNVKPSVVRLFRVFGLRIRVENNGKRLRREDGTIGRIYTLSFDKDAIAMRNCMDRQNYVTGDTFDTQQEAFAFYFHTRDL